MENTNLSERELEIIRLVGQGKSNKEIAQILFISVNTVKVHLANIFKKIKVSSRTEATIYAIEHGIGGFQRLNLKSDEIQTSLKEDQANSLTNWQSFQRKYWWFLLVVIFIVIGTVILFILQPTDSLSVQQFQATLQRNRWEAIGKMPSGRINHSSIVVDSNLFLIGGDNDSNTLDLVESFDVNERTISRHASKPTPVSMTTAVSLSGKIYVPGGKDASGDGTDVVEVFDPRTNLWTELARMPISIYDSGVVTYEGKIYVFGGINGGKVIDDVMRYDPSTNNWTLLAPMPDKRARPGVLVFEDSLYIIGGYNDSGPINSTLFYFPGFEDSDEYVWQEGIDFPSTSSIIQGVIVGGTPLVLVKDAIWQYLPIDRNWVIFDQNSELINEGQSVAGSDVYLYTTGGSDSEGMAIVNVNRFQVVYTLVLPILNENAEGKK